MPIKYYINKKLNLLYTIFYGEVGLSDCQLYADAIFNDPDIDSTSRTLAYLIESTLIFKIEEVEEFARLIIDKHKFKLGEKLAILIDSPRDTVAATIYSQALINSTKQIKVELFCTLDAALLFLGLPGHKDEINNLFYKTSMIKKLI